jgi:hypothetical protein
MRTGSGPALARCRMAKGHQAERGYAQTGHVESRRPTTWRAVDERVRAIPSDRWRGRLNPHPAKARHPRCFDAATDRAPRLRQPSSRDPARNAGLKPPCGAPVRSTTPARASCHPAAPHRRWDDATRKDSAGTSICRCHLADDGESFAARDVKIDPVENRSIGDSKLNSLCDDFACAAVLADGRHFASRRAQGRSRLAVAQALPLASMPPGHALTAPSTARGLGWTGCHRICRVARKGAPLVENRPRDASKLIGQRNSEHVVV